MSGDPFEVAPLWMQPVRWSSLQAVFAYYRLTCRIRNWGRLPVRRGPTLLVANHQHEFESAIIVTDSSILSRSWRRPIFTVSSRRMWEPGFLAGRLPPLKPFLRGLNFGALFGALGMQPIENELHARPFLSLAQSLHRLHGDVRLRDAFRPAALEKLPAGIESVADLLLPEHAEAGGIVATLSDLLEPYRKEILVQTRAELEADIAHFERLQRAGATIFLTPEGTYSGDGKMLRLRGILPRLAPLAEIWLAAISYDPFVGQRLSMLYRIAKAQAGVPLEVQLKRTRPVTTSALLASWLHGRRERFVFREAATAVLQAMYALPRGLFVDPELGGGPQAAVARALDGLERLGGLRRAASAYQPAGPCVHPQFPRTSDMVAYQANFHAETLEGANWEPARSV